MGQSRLDESRSLSWRDAEGDEKSPLGGHSKEFADLVVVVTTALSFLIVSLMFSLA